MRINENTKIIGERVVLVPYRCYHVPTYHEWMARAEIQELTSSEPLSIDEEYEMQAKWQRDDDKLTFIVLRKDVYEQLADCTDEEREIKSMIGDVNCFLVDEEENGDENEQSIRQQGEIEVMIVDEANRGRGYGSEAVFLVVTYCYKFLHTKLNGFLVKIGEDNAPSIKMFEKLGFVKCKYIKPFKQVCLMLNIDAFMTQPTESNRFNFSKDKQINIQPH